MKITQNKLFTPILFTAIDALLWILYIVFNVCYINSIDWDGYNTALEIGNSVDISQFYSSSSLILNFIGFLFLGFAIGISIIVMTCWIKYFINKLKERN